MMEQPSILVGKCYRDSRGVVFGVKAYDGQSVQFVAYSSIDQATADKREGSESWPRFLQDLQGEVPCPQF